MCPVLESLPNTSDLLDSLWEHEAACEIHGCPGEAATFMVRCRTCPKSRLEGDDCWAFFRAHIGPDHMFFCPSCKTTGPTPESLAIFTPI